MPGEFTSAAEQGSAKTIKAAEPKKARRGQNEGTGIMSYVRGGFYAQVSVGGKRVSVYGKTRDEVKQKRTEKLSQIGKGLISAPDKVTLGEWLERWLAGKQPHLSEGSHRDYAFTLNQGVPDEFKKMRLQSVKRTHMNQLELRLTQAGKGSRFRGKVFQYLRAAFEKAIEEDVIAVNPARSIRVKASQAEIQGRLTARDKALTETEMFAFLDAARDEALYPVFYILFSLGLRRGEALGLAWKNINFSTGEIKVIQQVKLAKVDGKLRPTLSPSLKTKNSRRTLYASDDLLEVLKERRKVQSEHRATLGSAWTENGLVFTSSLGTLIHPDNVNHVIARVRGRVNTAALGFPFQNDWVSVVPDEKHRFTISTPLVARAAGIGANRIRTLKRDSSRFTQGRDWIEGPKRYSGHPMTMWTLTGIKKLAGVIKTTRLKAFVAVVEKFVMPEDNEVMRPLSSHTGRHTAISQMLSDGEKLEVVSAIAGHGRPSTTADMYRTVYEDEKRAAVNSLSQRRAKRVTAVS